MIDPRIADIIDILDSYDLAGFHYWTEEQRRELAAEIIEKVENV